MKKIFTLAMGVLMTTLLFAADHRPAVILNSSRNFEVVIDGRSFMTQGRTITLDRLDNGRHTIRVYELRRSFRGRTQRQLVSQSSFRLRNQDLLIRINQNGEIFTKESRRGFGNDRYDRNGRDDRDDRYGRDRDYDRDDRNDRNVRDRNYDREFEDDHGWNRE